MALFEHLPGIVFYAKDLQSRFVAANSAMLATKKLLSPEELLGRTDRDYHPPALAEAYIEEDRMIMKSGEALANQSWFIIDQNGRPGWFRSSKTPLFSGEGKVIGLAGVRYAITTPEDRADLFQNLASVAQYLEKHFADQITAEQLADMAGLSVTHFNRRFSATFRMSPNRFLMSIRIEKARYLLTMTTKEIIDIATETGFYDQSHFTRHFRKITGITPKAYRLQYAAT